LTTLDDVPILRYTDYIHPDLVSIFVSILVYTAFWLAAEILQTATHDRGDVLNQTSATSSNVEKEKGKGNRDVTKQSGRGTAITVPSSRCH
jgi:hypothetical protein